MVPCNNFHLKYTFRTLSEGDETLELYTRHCAQLSLLVDDLTRVAVAKCQGFLLTKGRVCLVTFSDLEVMTSAGL